MVKINLNTKKNILIVSLSGELDHHTAKEVKNSIEEVIKNKDIKNLIFDFSSLDFMDSSGIGVIVGRYKLIHSLGGRVAIFGAKSNIRKLLSMSGIDKIIETFNTSEDAFKSLQEVKF